MSPAPANDPEIILGVDPSLRGTGWGVVETCRSKSRVLGFGVIQNPARVRPSQCLLRIRQELGEVIEKYRPTVVSIEGLFYAKNVRTALMMGQARGVVLMAAAEAGLEIFEYAPRRVKQSTVGVGRAAKSQVGFMVRALLRLTETPPPDAADALAIALTHANTCKSILERVSL